MNRRSIFFILFFGLVLLSSPCFAQDSLNLAALENYQPFTWEDNGNGKGIDIEVLNELSRRINIKIAISYFPWKRVLKNIKKGKFDGGFPGFKTPEREAYALYTGVPLHYSTFNIFVKKGEEFPYERIEYLYGKQVGIARGFSVNEEFDNAAVKGLIKITELDNTNLLFKMLMQKRLTCIVNNYHRTVIKINELGLSDEVVALPNPVGKPINSYLMFSRAAKIKNVNQLIERIDKALEEIHKDGTYDKICEKYLTGKVK